MTARCKHGAKPSLHAFACPRFPTPATGLPFHVVSRTDARERRCGSSFKRFSPSYNRALLNRPRSKCSSLPSLSLFLPIAIANMSGERHGCKRTCTTLSRICIVNRKEKKNEINVVGSRHVENLLKRHDSRTFAIPLRSSVFHYSLVFHRNTHFANRSPNTCEF